MDHEEGVAYVGRSTWSGRAVSVERATGAEPLRLAAPALTCGYAWGRSGTVPREVARAILLDATGNEMLSERLCRPFTWEVVAALPAAEFTITKAEVLAWISSRAPRVGPVIADELAAGHNFRAPNSLAKESEARRKAERELGDRGAGRAAGAARPGAGRLGPSSSLPGTDRRGA